MVKTYAEVMAYFKEPVCIPLMETCHNMCCLTVYLPIWTKPEQCRQMIDAAQRQFPCQHLEEIYVSGIPKTSLYGNWADAVPEEELP